MSRRAPGSFRSGTLCLVAAGTLALTVPAVRAAGDEPYRDAALPVDARVADLLSRMTLEEKFWQLFMLAGGLDDGVARYEHGVFGLQVGSACAEREPAACADAIQRHFVEETRLGIPALLFEEALHGLVQPGATAFPQAIGLAATFDTALVGEVAGAIARECRGRGIRQVLSPVVNIADDVRWGRVEETYGEDPFLAAEMGVAFASPLERAGVVTTPKHLVANVGSGGRDSYPIHLDERRLRTVYLPPFAACVRRGGSRSMMTAYNSLDGVPCSANAWLNTRWLKQDLGFSGFVISDAGAVGGANVLHFTAQDYADATAQALRGGLDVIFQTAFDHAGLFLPAFREGRIPPARIDDAVARVLRVKLELGLFERPYVEADRIPSTADRADSRRLARRAARESIVLLKNEGGTLPLARSLERVAVLGPDAAEARLGGYSGPGNDPVSILDGIREAVGPARVAHAAGCARAAPAYPTIPSEYLSSSMEGDAPRAGLTGAYFDNIELAGDPVFVRMDPAVDFRWTLSSPDPARLRRDFYSVRWSGRLRAPATGRYGIGLEGDDGYRLWLDGALVIDRWRKVSYRTVLESVQLEEGRDYDLRIEYFVPTGNARLRLVWDFGMPPGDDAGIAQAVALAAGSDAAIVVVGIEEGEFRDRAGLDLPGRQEELISRVAATGTPTVVVLVGGSAVTMARWLDRVPAVLDAWYPGEAGGTAVADVLFGAYNPAGRLPIGFPVAVGQVPLTYNHEPGGRGDDYLDLSGRPQFPFGYGLSYTRFRYADLRLAAARIAPGDATAVTFDVTNVGETAGDEVVQLYVRDELASVARPVLQLQGFRRVHLQPGETKALRFDILPGMLSLFDRDLLPVVEPGDFRIMIGASSADIRLRATLTVAPQPVEPGDPAGAAGR